MDRPESLGEMQRDLASAGPNIASTGDFLRGVLAGSGDCIKILDLDGRLQFMSDGGKRVMEVEDFEALKGCPWPDFWTGAGNAHALAAVAAAKDGKTYRFREAANTGKGNLRRWDVQVSPIRDSDGGVSHILSISRDVTEEWKAAELSKDTLARHKFLTEELTHRVKNTLATVLSLASQTFVGAPHREPLDTFKRRIMTLSDAYAILAEASWTSTSIGTVVESALAPYLSQTGTFAIEGPKYELNPRAALTLALAINELATNAMKYGALSQPSGRIEIVWSIGAEFEFSWREIGGPAVTRPTRSGFGSRLITKLLARDFGGEVDLRYEPGGLVCVLKAPVA